MPLVLRFVRPHRAFGGGGSCNVWDDAKRIWRTIEFGYVHSLMGCVVNSGGCLTSCRSDRVWFYNLYGVRGTLPSEFGRLSSLGEGYVCRNNHSISLSTHSDLPSLRSFVQYYENGSFWGDSNGTVSDPSIPKYVRHFASLTFFGRSTPTPFVRSLLYAYRAFRN